MTLSLDLPALRSRKKDAEIKAKRVVSGMGKGVKGILGKIARFGGWAFGQICRFFNLSFDRLWDVIVEAYFAIKYFDWKATDEALQQQIEQNNQRILNVAAEALGEQLGFGAVRIANFFLGRFFGSKGKEKASRIKVPVLSARVGLALAEEGQEEAVANLRRVLTTTMSAQVSNAFISSVLYARRNKLFGFESITKPQTNGSIAQKIEEKIETFPKWMQQPLENLIEGFEDGIIEAGYVVATTIDDHVAAMQYAQRNGYKRTVEVTPEKGSNEKLTFTGTQQEVKEQMQMTLYGNYPLIKNRDIGEYFGNPIEENIKLKPQLRTLKLIFNEYSEPPFRRKGVLGKRSEIAIPDCKAGLTWKELKTLVKPFTTGEVFVSGRLKNGRPIQGWFVSESEGIRTLTELAKLSTEDLDPDSFRSSTGTAKSSTKKPRRMHPVRAALVFPRRKNGEKSGLVGNAQRLELWQNEEPKDAYPFK
ncbi:MAG: hypothetical protein ACPL4I_11125 [Bacteroidota bacterium]